MYLPMVGKRVGYVPPFAVQFYAPVNGLRLAYSIVGGIDWIRWPASWASVEPTNTVPANYDWALVDQSVISATVWDIRLILTIADQPPWAATYGMGPVTDTADLIEFVSALVERYDGDGLADAPGSPVVEYFEVYNEPDNFSLGYAEHGGWGYWGHHGADYAELLEVLYPVVKAANPKAKVVFGGIALDWFDYQGGPFDSQFLDDVLAACRGRQCFDVMSFHYFTAFRSRWEQYGPDVIGKTNYVRQRMAAHGYGRMPLFCTEIGWHNAISQRHEIQSRYVVQGYVRGLAAQLDVVGWWFIWDDDIDSLPGLLDANQEPKPAYHAFRNMTLVLGEADYLHALTPAQTGSKQLVGYVFERLGRRLDVVWTEDSTRSDPDDDPSLPFTVNASTIRVIDKFGNEVWVNDEDDGTVDGRVTLVVGGSPYYVEYDP
jgi:hypothetical protein